MINKDISRRAFTGAGLATVGLLWTPKALALPVTAESPMGPFFPVTLPADSDLDLTWVKGRKHRAEGQVIEISGRVLDAKGNPIRGAIIDLWQANAAGRYDHPRDISKAPLDPNFQSYASLRTDATGAWRIVTIKPGGYDSPIGHRTPHIHFDVRGREHRNVAQLYFPEETVSNAVDRLYKDLGAEAATSVALRNRSETNKYTWDIVLMG